MTRLVVRNTVDQAMMNIKDRKRIEAHLYILQKTISLI